MTALCAGAALVGADLWFSDVEAEREEAKRICDRCTQAPGCLRGALERGEQHGVWAGMWLGPREVEMAGPDEPQGIPVVVYALADHGTRQRYQQGCHCGDCTKANAVGVAQHRADHQYDPPKPDVPKAEPLSLLDEIALLQLPIGSDA